MIGYKLRRSECNGWLFLGTEPKEVSEAIRSELEMQVGIELEQLGQMIIEGFEITQEEIDNMPEFEGW